MRCAPRSRSLDWQDRATYPRYATIAPSCKMPIPSGEIDTFVQSAVTHNDIHRRQTGNNLPLISRTGANRHGKRCFSDGVDPMAGYKRPTPMGVLEGA